MRCHRIRLRGPWTYRWLEPLERTPAQEGTTGESPRESGRVEMPTTWREVFADRAGRVRFTRRFGRPTNLSPGERVLLVLEGVGGAATLELNGRWLGEIPSGRKDAEFDITDRLQDNNRVTVEIAFDPTTAAAAAPENELWREVALEIRADEEPAS